MDSYIEIKLRAENALELPLTWLMSKTFEKLHRQLGQTTQGRVGVSFPRQRKTLGDTLRLHGTAADLSVLMQSGWMQGLQDYAVVSEVLSVPTDARHCTFHRIQAKSAHNKRKRAVAKGWLSEQQALEQIPNTDQQRLDLPYLQLKSKSNNNLMRVFIKKGAESATAVTGQFNAYGLSRTATVPCF